MLTLSAKSCPVQLSGSQEVVAHDLDLALVLVRVVRVVLIRELVLKLLEHLDAVVHCRVHCRRMGALQLAQLKPSFRPHGRSQDGSNTVRVVAYKRFSRPVLD
eukprot:6184040-Pleurochrysis_carterae.AAC.4